MAVKNGAYSLEEKQEALAYFNKNEVPKQIEQLLNKMFKEKPSDIFGYMVGIYSFQHLFSSNLSLNTTVFFWTAKLVQHFRIASRLEKMFRHFRGFIVQFLYSLICSYLTPPSIRINYAV